MSRSTILLLAVLLLLGFGLLAPGPTAIHEPAEPVDPQTVNRADAGDAVRAIDLSSDDLPDPVRFRVGNDVRSVNRFRLFVPALSRSGGAGVLTLTSGPLSFNDYGDAAPAGRLETAEVSVTLHGWEDTSIEGTLYEIRQPDLGPAGRLWLYLVPEPADEHRLIVWLPGKGQQKDPARWPGWGEGNPDRVLAVRPPQLPPDPLPLGSSKQWPTLAGLIRNPEPIPSRREPNPQQVSVSGHPGGQGQLHLDPNYLYLGPDGRVAESTLLGRSPISVTFQSVGPDPLGRERKAFELVPTPDGRRLYNLLNGRPQGNRTFLVVYASEPRGPHRLVVKEGTAVRQVISLTDFERENRLRPIRDRLRLPAKERAAVDRLAALCGPTFSFRTVNRHVWTITVSGDASQIDPLLADLTKLADLNYESAILPPTGLPSLRQLPELSSIRIVGDVSDEGLASLADAKKLRSVQVFASAGLTSRGLQHLARLPGVVLLQVSLPVPVLNPPAADEVLRELSAAPSVEQLHVWNIRPSDAGVVHLRGLVSLRSLVLSHCDRLTPVGLERLAEIPSLQSIYLYRSEFPDDAIAAFRSRRPKIELSTRSR